MRRFSWIAALGLIGSGFATGWAVARQDDRPARGRVTLLGILADWKYPGSEMLDGASMSDGGNPQVQSVKCQSILTTADPVEKVLAFYSKKLKISEGSGPREARTEEPGAVGSSITTQDDSRGRPVRIRVIVVNRADSSTTLVISRAEGEKKTHIAWSHYLRLVDRP